MALKSILIGPKQNIPPCNRLKCALCKERFWSTSKYIEHMSTHKHFMLSCNICNKGFYDQKQLDEHYVIHSEVINTYDCGECSRKFLQKYQLEQHMQFHDITPNESPPAKKRKKSVHFNNILEESRSIDDFEIDEQNSSDKEFSPSDEEFSSSDDEFSSDEDFNPINKITTTRSGRVVKPKKFFVNEPAVKRKYRNTRQSIREKSVGDEHGELKCRKVTESNSEISVTAEKDEKIKDVESSSESLLVAEEDADINDVESNPENLFTANKDDQMKDIESSPESSHTAKTNLQVKVAELSLKSLPLAEKNEQMNTRAKKSNSEGSRTVKKCDTILNESTTDKNCNLKELRVVIKRIPDSLYNKCIADGNIYRDKTLGTLVLPNHELIQNNSSKLSNSSTIKVNYSQKQTSKSILGKRGTVNNGFPKLASIKSKPPNVPTSSKLCPVNEFMYVGPKSDLSKIHEVIREVKAMSKEKTSSSNNTNAFPHSGLAQGVGTDPATCQPNGIFKNTRNYSKRVGGCKPGADTMNKLPIDSESGILDKKIVKNFLVVKVTPEYMRKIQRESLEGAIPTNSKKFSPTTLQVSNINRITKISPSNVVLGNSLSGSLEILPNVSFEKSQNSSFFPNISPVNAPNITLQYSPNISFENISMGHFITDDFKINNIKDGINLQKPHTIEQNNPTALVTNHEPMNELSKEKEEKLRQRIQAKLEEKERRKKEKYEFKKKMRYMEKLLCEGKKNYSEEKISQSEVLIEGKTTENCKASEKSIQKTSSNVSTNSKTSENSKGNEKICKNSESSVKTRNKSKNTNIKSNSRSDPYSDTSIVTKNTFTISCPCNSKSCTNSTHINLADLNSNDISTNLELEEFDTIKSATEAVEKARDISTKFNKNLTEVEHLYLLNKLEKLVTEFNIAKKCPFLMPIVRFCRLYVNSSKVKEQALSLNSKLLKVDS